MLDKKYRHYATKAVITDKGGGRVFVLYKRSPRDVDDALDLAQWTAAIVGAIHERHMLPLRVIADVCHLEKPILNSEIRNIYQEIIESDMVEKMAAVGPPATYLKLATIKVLLLRHRDRIRYFFDMDGAKEWIGWHHKS